MGKVGEPVGGSGLGNSLFSQKHSQSHQGHKVPELIMSCFETPSGREEWSTKPNTRSSSQILINIKCKSTKYVYITLDMKYLFQFTC